MFKTLRKLSILFFVFLVVGQSFSNQIGEFVGRAKAATTSLNVIVSDHTWDKIGLDSSNVNVGPHSYLIQGRVSNTGTEVAKKVIATASGGSTYIHLTSAGPIQLGDIPAGEYRDAFFVINIDPDTAAYDKSATFTITADADNTSPDSGQRTVSVERFTPEERNNVQTADVVVSPEHPVVGDTFTVTIPSESASCYEDIMVYPTFDPSILQLLSYDITYNIGSHDVSCRERSKTDIWGDSSLGRLGNKMLSVLTFKALAIGSTPLNYLMAQKSGGCYYYDKDYGNIKTITISPQLSIEKKVDKASANPGETLTYTLNYNNSGNDPATGVVISDTLNGENQNYLSYVNGSGGEYNGGTNTVSFDLGTVAAGASGSVSFQAKITDNMPLGTTVIKNTGKLSSVENGEIISNEVSTVVNAFLDLKLTKIDTPDPVQAGGDITYTLSYENAGNLTSHHTMINDFVPANTNFSSAENGGTESSGIVTWNLGDLKPGDKGTVSFKVEVKRPLDNGTIIINNARIFSDEVEPIFANAETTVESSPVFALIKTGTPNPVQPGEIITYTISYGNSGNMDATNVVITDPIPAGTTFVNDPLTFTGTFDGSKVVWNIGHLVAGVTGMLTFQVRVNSDAANDSQVLNHVDLTSDQGNLFDETETQVVKPVIEIEKAVDKNEATPGERLNYIIRYRNTGGVSAHSVVISDLADDNLTDIAVEDGGIALGQTITWVRAELPNSDTWSEVHFSAKIVTPLNNGTIIPNKANIATTETGSSESNEVQTVVNSAPVINIVKVSDPSGEVNPDGDIAYTITVNNTGTMDAGEMTLIDHWTFDSDKVTTFVDGSATTGATIDNNNQIISWNLDGINVGDEPQIFTFKLHTNPTNPNSGTFAIRNSACLERYLEARNFFSDGEENLCSNEVINTVTYNAHLNITKEADPLIVKPGQTVTYKVNVTNPGTADAKNVRITDTLPVGFSYVSGSAKLNNVAYEPTVIDNQLEWQIANMATGEVLTLSYEVKVGSLVATGMYRNLAVASAENVEENPQAEANTRVIKVIIPQVLGASTSLGVLPQTGSNYSSFNAGFSLFLLFILLVVFSLRPKKLMNIFIK